ncbi:hypothetical protein MKX01_000306 [Papaver californicum]|nr:hypothetical protein MKX01_000306 [Papaver californicum]
MSRMIEKSQNLTTRRSANYEANAWDHDFENYARRLEKLKEGVRLFLGVDYHFDGEIRASLDTINNKNYAWEKNNIFTTALRFRLLRKYRYEVSQDVFKHFMDEMRNTSSTLNDIEGMLSEDMLDEAQKLTIGILKEYLMLSAKDQGNTNFTTEWLVHHALELPLQWITQRVEARWYIDIYEMMEDMDLLLLKFAKLDFDILQAKYQHEVVERVVLYIIIKLLQKKVCGEVCLDRVVSL